MKSIATEYEAYVMALSDGNDEQIRVAGMALLNAVFEAYSRTLNQIGPKLLELAILHNFVPLEVVYKIALVDSYLQETGLNLRTIEQKTARAMSGNNPFKDFGWYLWKNSNLTKKHCILPKAEPESTTAEFKVPLVKEGSGIDAGIYIPNLRCRVQIQDRVQHVGIYYQAATGLGLTAVAVEGSSLEEYLAGEVKRAPRAKTKDAMEAFKARYAPVTQATLSAFGALECMEENAEAKDSFTKRNTEFLKSLGVPELLSELAGRGTDQYDYFIGKFKVADDYDLMAVNVATMLHTTTVAHTSGSISIKRNLSQFRLALGGKAGQAVSELAEIFRKGQIDVGRGEYFVTPGDRRLYQASRKLPEANAIVRGAVAKVEEIDKMLLDLGGIETSLPDAWINLHNLRVNYAVNDGVPSGLRSLFLNSINEHVSYQKRSFTYMQPLPGASKEDERFLNLASGYTSFFALPLLRQTFVSAYLPNGALDKAIESLMEGLVDPASLPVFDGGQYSTLASEAGLSRLDKPHPLQFGALYVHKVWEHPHNQTRVATVSLCYREMTVTEQGAKQYGDVKWSKPFIVAMASGVGGWTRLDAGNYILRDCTVIEPTVGLTAASLLFAFSGHYPRIVAADQQRIDTNYARLRIRIDAISRLREEKQLLEVEKTKAQKRLIALVEGSRPNVKLRGIEFRKDGLTMDDTTLVCDHPAYHAWLKSLTPSLLDDLELNDILTSILEEVFYIRKGEPLDKENYAGKGVYADGGVRITLCGVDIHAVGTSNARNYRRYTINGKRINAAEIVQLCLRTLCFSEQEKFDGFVNQVSKCSLRIMGYVASGVVIKVLNPAGAVSEGLLQLRRKEGKNYIVVSSKLVEEEVKDKDGKTVKVTKREEDVVPVTKINSVLALANDTSRRSAAQVFTQLRSAAPELTPAQCMTIIKTSVEFYLEAIRQSKILLKETITRFKVKKVTDPFKREVTGIARTHASVTVQRGDFWSVPGISGATYYIRDGDGYPIFSSGGNAICIVDRSATSVNKTVGYDKLVSRIYAVALDSHTVRDVGTLAAYVGKK